MLKKYNKMNDITKILIAMLLGSLLGILLGEKATCIGFIGTIWLNLMKMFLVPIVICMMVKGTTSMDNPKTLGRIGIRIVVFYMFTTVAASVLGLVITGLFHPGVGFQFTEGSAEAVEIAELPTVGKFFTDMFSSNIFATFNNANMMQVLIIAVIMGVAIVMLPEDKRTPVRNWFVSMADLVMSIISIALKLAPIGVFCLMANALGKYGINLLLTMSKLLGTFYLCCILHLIVVYCLILWLFTGITPLNFLKRSFPTIAAAASTCSSAAVIPVSMNVAKENFEVEDSVAGLGITLGGTINKDGVAVLCSVVILFSAQAMGIALTPGQIFNTIFVTALVTSTGSGVPGGGLMNLMIVAAAVGIPLEIVIMVGGFYRFFDMGTTTMNCLGDMSATVIIDRLEKKRTQRLGKTANS